MLPEKILYEDNHLIAVNKWCGEIVQADKSGDVTLLADVKQFIKARDRKPGNVFLGLCHRLDRPSSGVVIFAKTGKALSRMNDEFRGGRVHKNYWAVVIKAPPLPEDHLINYLVRNSKQNKSYAYWEAADGAKIAELKYRLTAKSDRYWLLDIDLITGRHHQIRAQLSAVGCTIRGDLKYGAPHANPDGGIDLHARAIVFAHPVKKTPVNIAAPEPSGRIWDALKLTP
ncbi:MAG: RNA pseudouridine synthase [Spirochaetales bacterium]|nr:RNA pseudouridine synthase [Spirochaetales bacterium]